MHSRQQALIRMHNGATAGQILQQVQDHITAHDQQQQQQHHHHHNQQQHDSNSMTILESLEPAGSLDEQQQPVFSSLDPLQEQPSIIHHLAPSPPVHDMHLSEQPADQDDELQQQQQQQAQDKVNRRIQQRRQEQQRPTVQLMEGIAECGGPMVKWLLDNYEIAEGESLPRSMVYNHYLAHCRQLRMSGVNAASFGKLIRSVFLGLKTRRLGTRGHSKYHYFGVRANQNARLAWLRLGVGKEGQVSGAGCSSGLLLNDSSNNGTDGSESDSTGDGGRSSSMMSSSNKRLRRSNNESETPVYAHQQYRPDSHQDYSQSSQASYTTAVDHSQDHHHQQQQQQTPTSNGLYYPDGNGPPLTNGFAKHEDGATLTAAAAAAGPGGAPCYIQAPRYDHYDLSNFRNLLGGNKASLVDEHWPERDAQLLEPVQQHPRPREETNKNGINHAQHLTSGLVDTFESQYKSYYKRLVEFLSELQFGEIEHLTMDFWHPVPVPAAHETIHWTSTTTSAVSTPSGPCEAVAPTVVASTNGQHYEHHHQQNAHQHQLLQQDIQMMYQNINNLSYDQLHQITSHPAMIDRINQIDCRLYSAIESFMVVDMVQPLPRPLVHHLRLFARNICSWIEQATKDYRPEFINEKMKSTRAFEQALRRSTSVNHLATASKSIWSKRAVLQQMGSDLSRLDLHDIELQAASLMTIQERFSSSDGVVHLDSDQIQQHNQHNNQHTVTPSQNGRESVHQTDRSTTNNIDGGRIYPSCRSNDNIENHYSESNSHGHNPDELSEIDCGRSNNMCGSLRPVQLVQNLVLLFEDAYPSEAWPNWCQALVESRVCGQSFEEARDFILKWNFFMSLISRELTLKSAPSLGSFQLIKLLFDEYMFYLVVKRLAQVQHKTPTQLLRPSVRYGNI